MKKNFKPKNDNFRYKNAYKIHTIGLFLLRSTKNSSSSSSLLNNGSFDLKSPNSSKIWSKTAGFSPRVPHQKWPKRPSQLCRKGGAILPRYILKPTSSWVYTNHIIPVPGLFIHSTLILMTLNLMTSTLMTSILITSILMT